ncbi:hypothetical protein [Schleiferilactobacillus harbinensis]|uniref:hypothetical protein n=1 Tax=Schleiferilactobacillus harbinensis TaxID=304207 RepID=UPI0039EC37FC
MTMGNWQRTSRTLAVALLAGSLALGAISAAAPAINPQPVAAAAAVAATHYPQGAFNYGDNHASIYVDPTNFTADQVATVNEAVANVQTMLNGIFTITVTNTRSAADMIITGKDLSNTESAAGEQVGGSTTINYNRVVNHIAQHPNGTQIVVDDSYRSYATSKYFTPEWSPQLPSQGDPQYQVFYNYYQEYYDKWQKNTLLIDTEHEIGHGLSLDHLPVAVYGSAIMNPAETLDRQGNPLVDLAKDPTYIRAAQAIYGGQAIALGKTDVKQPTQGYHNSTSDNSSNSGNTGNTGNSANGGNSGNANNGTSTRNNTVKPASGTVNVYQASGAEVYSDANFTNDTGRKLPQYSQWKGFAIVSDAAGNPVGYNVGGQQYVKFSEAAFIYPMGHTNESQTVSGVFKINVPGHPTWAPRSTTTPSKSKASSAAAPGGGYLPARPWVTASSTTTSAATNGSAPITAHSSNKHNQRLAP